MNAEASEEHDTDKDAAAAHGIYQDSALGSTYQYPTNKHYIMADKPPDPDSSLSKQYDWLSWRIFNFENSLSNIEIFQT